MLIVCFFYLPSSLLNEKTFLIKKLNRKTRTKKNSYHAQHVICSKKNYLKRIWRVREIIQNHVCREFFPELPGVPQKRNRFFQLKKKTLFYTKKKRLRFLEKRVTRKKFSVFKQKKNKQKL